MTAPGAPSAIAWTTESTAVCGAEVAFQRAGQGTPILVLPRENGHPPSSEFLDRLAESAAVVYPWLPGFHGGDPASWDWLADSRDLAVVLRQFIAAAGLERPLLVGLGYGGWLAAEIATMGAGQLRGLVLVGAMGIQPRNGYIYDQFLGSTESYARAAFEDESVFADIYGEQPEFDQLESWETDREMTSRIAWKPYMYNRSLQRLLAGATVPALVAWGEEDGIVPLECASLYRDSLPNATLETYPGAGHALDLERPAQLAARVAEFCRGLA